MERPSDGGKGPVPSKLDDTLSGRQKSMCSLSIMLHTIILVDTILQELSLALGRQRLRGNGFNFRIRHGIYGDG
jgi:hypothetical protein